MYPRMCKPLLTESFFLFGARGTGKSTLLKSVLKPSQALLWVDLLDSVLYQQLLIRPRTLFEMIPAHFNKDSWVVIDEVQRVPELLNLVHSLIESRKIKFALTGSSARKLKRGGANLLAGRAFLNSLYPLSARELGADFRLEEALAWGSLPKVFELSDERSKKEYLRAYVATYLREEIREEQIIRQLDPFVRFLEVAAQFNGQIVNAAKIGREAATDTKAILRYFQVLTDTLVGFFLEPFHTSIRKVQTSKAKFYFFDTGIKRSLEGTLDSQLVPGTYAYGKAFEHFFVLECHRLREYLRQEDQFYYVRTKDDVEINLLVERSRKEIIAVEIKSAERVDEKELGSSFALSKALGAKRFLVASREVRPRRVGEIEILPWEMALREIYPSG